ncbi:MAG: cache domain-containing protein [Chloroflexota bacterium]
MTQTESTQQENKNSEQSQQLSEKPQSSNTISERLLGAFHPNRSIQMRILITSLLIVLIAAAPIALGTFWIAQTSSKNQVMDQFESVVEVKKSIIENWLNSLQSTLASSLPEPDIASYAQILVQSSAEQPLITSQEDLDATSGDTETKRLLTDHLTWVQNQAQLFDEIFLLNLQGRVVASTDEVQEGKIHINLPYFQRGRSEPFTSTPFYAPSLGRLSIVSTRPLKDANGDIYGVIAGRASMATLSETMLKSAGLGDTGVTYLVSSNRGLLTSTKNRTVTDTDLLYVRSDGVEDTLYSRGQEIARRSDTINFNAEDVAGAYQWVSSLQVVMVAEQERQEAYSVIDVIRNISIGVGIVAIAAAILLSLVLSRRLSAPLLHLGNAASMMEGESFNREQLDELNLNEIGERRDEVGQLTRVFQRMAEQVYAREQRLKQQVKQLQIVIDETKRKQQVEEITDSDFFQDLTQKAGSLRQRRTRSTPRRTPKVDISTVME